MTVTNSTAIVEQWGIFELELHGSAEGNPYQDVELTAQFASRWMDFTMVMESFAFALCPIRKEPGVTVPKATLTNSTARREH